MWSLTLLAAVPVLHRHIKGCEVKTKVMKKRVKKMMWSQKQSDKKKKRSKKKDVRLTLLDAVPALHLDIEGCEVKKKVMKKKE